MTENSFIRDILFSEITSYLCDLYVVILTNMNMSMGLFSFKFIY